MVDSRMLDYRPLKRKGAGQISHGILTTVVAVGDIADSIRPLRRVEYERMVELGLFVNEKVELIQGFIVRMSPPGARHACVVDALHNTLLSHLGGTQRAAVRLQSPLAVSEDSEPAPDVAVVPVDPSRDRHPSTAYVVIEVAEASPAAVRDHKAELYASAGVPEYWVVDTTRSLVEVCTDVVYGVYSRVIQYRAGQHIVLGAFPDVAIAVGDILR
jgi:Uma2 family endonuclease